MTLKKFPTATDGLARVNCRPFQPLSEEDQQTLEHMVCRLYDESFEGPLDELRMKLFSAKSQDLERIPPTQDAWKMHVQRASFQASLWVTSNIPIQAADPRKHAWREEDGVLVPHWTTKQLAGDVFNVDLTCSCKKGCQAGCSCKKAGLHCTLRCKCGCRKV